MFWTTLPLPQLSWTISVEQVSARLRRWGIMTKTQSANGKRRHKKSKQGDFLEIERETLRSTGHSGITSSIARTRTVICSFRGRYRWNCLFLLWFWNRFLSNDSGEEVSVPALPFFFLIFFLLRQKERKVRNDKNVTMCVSSCVLFLQQNPNFTFLRMDRPTISYGWAKNAILGSKDFTMWCRELIFTRAWFPVFSTGPSAAGQGRFYAYIETSSRRMGEQAGYELDHWPGRVRGAQDIFLFKLLQNSTKMFMKLLRASPFILFWPKDVYFPHDMQGTNT